MDNGYLNRIFNTSPGNFTLRETKLIKHYLTFNGNLSQNHSARKLWKAFNQSDNNTKWILKTFLVVNLQNKTKHRRGLKDVVTTINGNVLKKRKLDLVLLKNKASIEVKYTNHRFVMFPDRVGSGKLYHYQVQKMIEVKIPQVKTPKIVNNSKILGQPINNTLSRLNAEIELFSSALLAATGAIPFLFKLQKDFDDLIDILNTNRGELDCEESGWWFRKWCVTDKAGGNKLTVTYAKRDSRTDPWEHHVYKFFDVDVSKTAEYDWAWVKTMYELVAPRMRNQIDSIEGKLQWHYKKEDIYNLYDKCVIFQTTINAHCNDTYTIPNKAIIRETYLYNLGTEIIEIINGLINIELSNDLGVPKRAFDTNPLYGEYDDRDRISDEEIIKIFKSIENDE